jgi:hypothetical protein
VPKLERRLRRPSVVAKHPAETFVALDRTGTAEAIVAAIDQSITDSLLVPLAVIVLEVLADDSQQRASIRDLAIGPALISPITTNGAIPSLHWQTEWRWY